MSDIYYDMHMDSNDDGPERSGFLKVLSIIGKSVVISVIALICFILPAAISYLVYMLFRKLGLVKDGDMKLDK